MTIWYLEDSMWTIRAATCHPPQPASQTSSYPLVSLHTTMDIRLGSKLETDTQTPLSLPSAPGAIYMESSLEIWPHYPFRSRWWFWFRALVFKLNTTNSKSHGRTLSSNWHKALCVKQWQEEAFSSAPSPFGSAEAMWRLAEHGKCPYIILTWLLATPVHGHQVLLPTSGSSR